jgi:hypothetical protein
MEERSTLGEARLEAETLTRVMEAEVGGVKGNVLVYYKL